MLERLKQLLAQAGRRAHPRPDESIPVTTGGGDHGRSSLFSGERYFKDELVFEALGDLDELNSWLGIVRRRLESRPPGDFVPKIQTKIGTVCAIVATSPNASQFNEIPKVEEQQIRKLEEAQSRLRETASIPARFITPGEFEGVPEIDVARATARRAERRVVHVIRETGRPDIEIRHAQAYLNRVSDYLSVLARAVEQRRH